MMQILQPRSWIDALTRLTQNWHSFWFTPADPVVLALQRIACGGLLFYTLAATTPILLDFHGPDAFIDQKTANYFRQEQPISVPPTDWEPLPQAPTSTESGKPREPKLPPILRPERRLKAAAAQEYFQRWQITPEFVYDEGTPEFSPYFHLRSPFWIYLTHTLGLLTATLFTLGLGTRVTSALAWAFSLFYTHRVMFAAFGMDTMFAIALLYLMLSPCGARLSLDRFLLGRRRRRFGFPDPDPGPAVSANVGLRLFQIHFCLIYFSSALGKLAGGAWWNGTALWQTAANYEFTPDRFGVFTLGLTWLTQSRPVWEIVMSTGAAYTLLLELSFPFLIWYKPWRPLLLSAAVLLHTGIALMMGLTIFSALMVVLLAAFLPALAVQRFLDRLMGVKATEQTRSLPERESQEVPVPPTTPGPS